MEALPKHKQENLPSQAHISQIHERRTKKSARYISPEPGTWSAWCRFSCGFGHGWECGSLLGVNRRRDCLAEVGKMRRLVLVRPLTKQLTVTAKSRYNYLINKWDINLTWMNLFPDFSYSLYFYSDVISVVFPISEYLIWTHDYLVDSLTHVDCLQRFNISRFPTSAT